MTGRGTRIFAVVFALGLASACGRLASRPSDPLSAEERNDLGVAYYARGENELAARQFRRALALRPGWVRALVNLGDAQLAMGDADAAIATYGRARAAQPEDPAIANNLAWALLQHERRWPEAEPIIRGALTRDPKPRGYYLDTLGLLLLKKGEAGPALEAFRAALQDGDVQDRQVRALVLRHAGDALSRLGDSGGAALCYRSARELEAGMEAGRRADPDPSARDTEEVGPINTVC